MFDDQSKRAVDLETLLFRFNLFQRELVKIIEQRKNMSF